MSSASDDDDWESEDPNLLNNPELLYRECAKLPLPVPQKDDEEFWETVKLTRELLLDHNFILEALSNREEFRGSKESAREVIENVISNFEADCNSSEKIRDRYKEMPYWEEAAKQKIFSTDNTDGVAQWKVALNSFLDAYLKIRKFVPKDSLEDYEDGDQKEIDKEECKYLPLIVEELEKVLKSL